MPTILTPREIAVSQFDDHIVWEQHGEQGGYFKNNCWPRQQQVKRQEQPHLSSVMVSIMT